MFRCEYCGREFVNKVTLDKHIRERHLQRKFSCLQCTKRFFTEGDLSRHVALAHNNTLEGRTFQLVESRHNDVCRRFHFELRPATHFQLESLLRNILCIQIFRLLKRELKTFHYLQVYFTVTCQYAKLGALGEPVDREVFAFRSNLHTITRTDLSTWTNFMGFLDQCIQEISTRAENLLSVGSGWVMNFVSQVDTHIIGRSIMGMSSGKIALKDRLTKILKQRYRKINVIEKCISYLVDEEILGVTCFFAAVAHGLMQSNHKCTMAAKKVVKHFKGKTHKPMKLRNVPYFERANGIAINVFGWENKNILPLFLSKQSRNKQRINILHLPPHDKDDLGHYVYINNLSAFISTLKRFNGYTNNKEHNSLLICELCLHTMVSPKKYQSHVHACLNPHNQHVLYPQKDSMLKATASAGKSYAPLLGFLDFEARMSPKSNSENFKAYNCDNCAQGGPPKLCTHSERVLCEQLPMTFSFYILDHMKNIVLSKTYSNDNDVMSTFFETLNQWQTSVLHLLQANKTLHWSPRLQTLYDKQYQCYICKGEFLPGHKLFQKVRDHCHYTPPKWNKKHQCLESLFLGAAHAKCNLQRCTSYVVPVYVHNFMSYDSNFLLKHLNSLNEFKNISAIPYNSNKLRTLTIKHFTFLDSYQIMNASLAQLSEDLRVSGHNWNILKQSKLCSTDQQLLCLLRKSIYPYEWVRSVDQLVATQEFPPKDAFFSKLANKTVSDEDYAHGKNVYKQFNCNNMLEYTELYCKLDTLLLAEIVLTFRQLMKEKFCLWIENYISIPQLAYDAFLLQNKIPLQLCHDPTMVQMFENNIRGGVSFVNNRHIRNVTNASEILYVDANNLYGFAQCLPLPVGAYRWLSDSEIALLKLDTMVVDQPMGYVFEVDLEIPSSVHDKLDDLPLAPQAQPVVASMLSPYSAQVQNELLGNKKASNYNTFKLITSHLAKTRYVVHYLNLQFYVRLGCRITKIHSVISFKQLRFLQKHILHVSQLRAKATSKFEQLLYKLIVNSLYGKFIQNCRKFLTLKVCSSATSLLRYTNDPKFHSLIPINKNVSLILLRKKTVTLDKLYAVGFTILELSKLHMYQLWYDHIQTKLPPLSAKLILTDTDSFIIQLVNITKVQALKCLKSIMDFSNYPSKHELFNIERKKVPGYLKDEYPCQEIEECVAVRSKCYFLSMDGSSTRVCKGIAQNVSATFPIDYYLSCVYSTSKRIKATMHSIRANKHVLTTKSITKICMSSGDDKRFQTCNLHSVGYGHWKIQTLLTNTSQCPKCDQAS